MDKNVDNESILTGFILRGLAPFIIFAGLFFCYQSENQVARYNHLNNQASQVVVEMKDINKVDPSLEGKLAYAVGEAKSSQDLEDPVLGIKLNGFTFKRDVSYYQIVEHKKKRKKNSRTVAKKYDYRYTYKETWVEKPVSSASFYNSTYKEKAVPPLITLENLSLVASNVTFGAYHVSGDLVESAHNSTAVSPKLSAEEREKLARKLGVRNEQLHITSSGIYIGKDPNTPHIGDVRISLSYVPMDKISLLAKVKGDNLERFHNPKDPSNISIGEIRTGEVLRELMFRESKTNATGGSSFKRILSLILVIFGCSFLPLSNLTENWRSFDTFRLALSLLSMTAGLVWLLNWFIKIGALLILFSLISFPLSKFQRKESIS